MSIKNFPLPQLLINRQTAAREKLIFAEWRVEKNKEEQTGNSCLFVIQ
jgi:hypothetical protein